VSHELSRRSFLAASAAAGAGELLSISASAEEGGIPGLGSGTGMPVALSSGNGLRATARAMELLRQGADTLDASIAGVSIVEEDPDDVTVGYGGLPNEDGVVELDCCVMHGPSANAGAVAAIQKIKTPSKVAKLVMTHTDHVLLAGEGALRFALAHGFKPEDLLTERARNEWLRWKAGLSDKDDWLTPEEAEDKLKARPTGTITCLALNEKGELSGVTSTSGLAFKLPGRVGDSPLVGAGLYVDNDVGAAGATGRGEAIILVGGSRIVVENMKHGMSPGDAIKDVLERIARKTTEPRLRDKEGRPAFNVSLYAVSRNGAYASGSLWSGKKFAVHDGKANSLKDCFFLFQRDPPQK
jgi:N4-(beta-N-acetylglucosaminyl)-L-asparaginase